MRHAYVASSRLEELAGLLAQWEREADVHAILLLTAADNGFGPSQLDPVLTECAKPVFGGVFPGIIYQGRCYRRGSVLLGIPAPVRLAVIRDLSKPHTSVGQQLVEHLPWSGQYRSTLFAFVDGFSSGIAALIDGLFDEYGLEINYIGGGCGDLDATAGASVITPEGVLEDAGILAIAQLRSGIGVAHGWVPVSSAMKVTATAGSWIRELNWRPAWEVYRREVARHSQQSCERQEFTTWARSYPLGIARLGKEMVIRDPVALEDGALRCVGPVRQGCYVHIMHGVGSSLTQAAMRARQRAEQALVPEPPRVELFFDCISRCLFLGQQIDQELASAATPDLPMLGALSIGEIANCGQEYLEFLNKTSVVGLLAD